MKNLTLLLLLFTSVTFSQGVQVIGKISLDPKMLIEGPHEGNDNFASSSLDMELQFGVEFAKRWRVSVAYQSHKEINYKKYSWLMIDYKLIRIPIRINNHKIFINSYLGIEGSAIFREFPNAGPTEKSSQSSMWHYGGNAELEIMITENVGLSSVFNYFRAEPALTRYGKKYRYEVMIGINIKSNKF